LEGDSLTADNGDSETLIGASNAMVAWLASSCSGELEPRDAEEGVTLERYSSSSVGEWSELDWLLIVDQTMEMLDCII
jgi:hypothetical protein